MRRFPLLVLLMVAIAAAAIAFLPSTRGQSSGRPIESNRLAPALRRYEHKGRSSAEKVRVIVKATDGIRPAQVSARLQAAGARISNQMEALGLTVAEMPLANLAEVASHDEIAWISPDQDVKADQAKALPGEAALTAPINFSARPLEEPATELHSELAH